MNPIPQCAPELSVPFTGCDAALQPPPAPGTPFHRRLTPRSISPARSLRSPPGKPGAAGQRRSPGAPGRDRHRVRGCGRRAGRRRGSTFTLANTGVPFVFIDTDRAEQPPLLLLGHRVRHQFAGFGTLQPGVGPDHQGGGPHGGGRQRQDRSRRSIAGIFARDQLAPARRSARRIDPANGTFSGPFPPANGASGRARVRRARARRARGGGRVPDSTASRWARPIRRYAARLLVHRRAARPRSRRPAR